MKKYIGLLFVGMVAFLMLSSSSSLKDEGIKFTDLTFEKAKKQAEKSGKLIFIDAYTDWCGPCKKMAATTFKDPEVGEVFNESFINLKIEMEKNPDGKEIARAYKVAAYPTLLILDSEGNLVKQVIGFQTKERLMALAESVL